MGTRATKMLRTLLLAAGVALMAACGGGSGDAPLPATPPASPAPTGNVGPAGGSVLSSDGKVRLAVDPGALSAGAQVSITKTAPEPPVQSTANFIPDSTYRFDGATLSFSSPALWELEIGSAGPLSAQVRTLAVTDNYAGYSCSGKGGKPVGPEWIDGNLFCDAGCTSISRQGNSPYDWDAGIQLCVPTAPLVILPASAACPPGYAAGESLPPDVLLVQLAIGIPLKACYLEPLAVPPALSGSALSKAAPCAVNGNKIGCKVSNLKPGTLSVFADGTPPSYVDLVAGPGGEVRLDANGNGTMLYAITAFDNKRMGFVELYELKYSVVPGPNGQTPQVVATRLATHTANAALGDPKNFGSGPQSIAFNQSDPPIRFFQAYGYDANGNRKLSPIVKVQRISAQAEVVSFTASPSTLPPPSGTATLSWTVANANAVTIDQGIGDVTNATVNGTGSRQVTVSATTTFTLIASNAQGSTATRTVTVTIAPDTTAPTVSLSANPATVSAPGNTLLTATVTDNVSVTQVEFYRGATLIGTDSTPGDGFTQSVSFTTGDAGTASFTAKAFDAAGNSTTSAMATVVVTVPVAADRYVSPTGSDSNPGTQSQPYKTLTKAFAEVGANGTVWLANGTYTWASEIAAGASAGDNKVMTLPAGRTLRASSQGQANVNFGFRVEGSGMLIGLNLRHVTGDTSFGGGSLLVVPSTAMPNSTVALKGVTLGAGASGIGTVLLVQNCATCTVTVDSNGVPNFNLLAADYNGIQVISSAGGSLTVSGGKIGHPTLSSTGEGCNQGVLARINGTGQVTLDGVAVELGAVTGGPANHPVAFCLGTQSGTTTAKLTLSNGSSVTQAGSSGRYRGFAVSAPASLELANATVSGPFSGIVGTTGPAQVTIANSTLQGATDGIVNNLGEYSEPSITLTNAVLQNFSGNAINLPHGGTVSITGGQIKDNSAAGVRLDGVPAPGFFSGTYTLTLRNATIANNGSAAADGAGLVLAGSAASVFNLGTASQPGGNTILGLDASKPGVRAGVPSSVTVNAVGNTWVANQQGASSTGTYGGSLVVTSGSGRNYTVTSGALRLSGN